MGKNDKKLGKKKWIAPPYSKEDIAAGEKIARALVENLNRNTAKEKD